MPSPRRFPPPWSIEEEAVCFIVRDATGKALGKFYFEDELGARTGVTVFEPSMDGKWLLAPQASAERRLLYPAS